MVSYVKGSIEDFEDIIDFGNYVFGIDFKKLLPKLYNGKIDTSNYHFMVKDNDKIKAMVGCFPLEHNVMDINLKVKGIGTVSVHPYARDKGYMIQLMNKTIREMKEESIDFAILSGQRQRYEYFEFTPTGGKIIFEVNGVNLKHKKLWYDNKICLKIFDELSEDDLKTIYILFSKQSVHASRDLSSFIDVCKSWNSKPLAVYYEERIVGYVILSESLDRVLEIYLEDYEILGKLLSNIIKDFDKEKIDIVVPIHRHELISCLVGICESYKIQPSTCLNIFNYKNFIKAFLSLKNSYETLEKGQLVIEILGREKIIISVGNDITVEDSQGQPDIKLSHLEAMNFLCSQIRTLKYEEVGHNNIIKSWFPLPFCYPEIDNV
ncbi:MAG: GNAT family N-acetyltransferase [Clostridium sp.]|uniref:GNAT family N-acetyltransferase n=1 Tax=Clostridium sp. TaxID=1506 RepID=UPI003D6D2913